MYCKNCKKEFSGTGKFCPICGGQLTKQNLPQPETKPGPVKKKEMPRQPVKTEERASISPQQKKNKHTAAIIIVVLALMLFVASVAVIAVNVLGHEREPEKTEKELLSVTDSAAGTETGEPDAAQKRKETQEEIAGSKTAAAKEPNIGQKATDDTDNTDDMDDTDDTEESLSEDGSELVLELWYLLPESNERILTEEDIEGMSVREINYAKNEIYARHGRRFRAEELQIYFDSQPWYEGTVEPDDFDDKVLSEIEKKNAEFLQAAETALGGYMPQ